MEEVGECPSDDERVVELWSIQASFPELVIDKSHPYVASLDLVVAPAEPVAITFGTFTHALPTPPGSDGESAAQDAVTQGKGPPQPDIRQLSYLPSITLKMSLPDGYPREKPPKVTLTSQTPWVPPPTLRKLQADVRSLWEDYGRDQVVFAYIDHLQQAAERLFDLLPGDHTPLALDRSLEIKLLDFDKQAKQDKFNQQTFNCSICLDPKKGAVCHRLSCSHVFCVQCLQDFYTSCITTGDISSVKCLEPSCATIKPTTGQKHDPSLPASDLLQIPLSHDLVRRYVDLRRKAELESDKYTIYCPRKWCQAVAKTDRPASPGSNKVWKNGDSEKDMPPPRERLAVCTLCTYAFCRVCLSGWHGEFVSCWAPNPAKISREEQASMDYLRKYSSPCPTCDAPCQKSRGCNHMICFKCKTHFCYLCSAWLAEENPYQHFNEMYKPCYMRLWELEEGDGSSEDGGEGGRHPPANDFMEIEELEGEVVDFPPNVVQVPVQPPQAPAPVPAPNLRVGALRAAQLANGQRDAGAQGPRVPRARVVGNGNANPEINEGLRHFLELVANDEEDEWDSDELEDAGDIEHLLGDGWGAD